MPIIAGGHMRKRRQIARGAHRTLRRDHRDHILRQHLAQQLHGLHPHAGGALRQRAEFQRHHQPRHGNRHRLANPGGVREHEVALQNFQIRIGDAHRRQFSKPGIDAVNRLAARQNFRHRIGTARNHRQCGGVKRTRRPAINFAPLRKADIYQD